MDTPKVGQQPVANRCARLRLVARTDHVAIAEVDGAVGQRAFFGRHSVVRSSRDLLEDQIALLIDRAIWNRHDLPRFWIVTEQLRTDPSAELKQSERPP